MQIIFSMAWHKVCRNLCIQKSVRTACKYRYEILHLFNFNSKMREGTYDVRF